MRGDFVLTNVRAFRNGVLDPPGDVSVVDGRIAPRGTRDTRCIDGAGSVLLPGLIDTHVHVESRQQLLAYGRWGVTTALDMGTPNWAATGALRFGAGMAALRSAGNVACAPRGTAVRKMGYAESSAVLGPCDAQRFVEDRVSQGVDYVKIIVEERLPFRPKPLNEDTITAITRAAHSAGLMVCVHATSVKTFQIASRAGADVLTHAPLAAPLEPRDADRLAELGVAVSPTLVMMKKLTERFPAPVKPKRITFANPTATVRTLCAAGVTILAGTDANSDPNAPHTIEHGASLHDEIALLVQSGLTPAAALLAATATAADTFGLTDRGRIAVGLRADLLLVEGDPTTNILDTQNIRAVWIGGEEVR